jgi:hypothetical protein
VCHSETEELGFRNKKVEYFKNAMIPKLKESFLDPNINLTENPN